MPDPAAPPRALDARAQGLEDAALRAHRGTALSTKDTIVAAAMELFGRQGYHATTVAQIEAAAGLSAGAGGLYRHFPSKRAL
ncbi:MAG TPA: helix-turn-helix domain-containing protein, partial [Micromonosporaceae bacterium]